MKPRYTPYWRSPDTRSRRIGGIRVCEVGIFHHGGGKYGYIQPALDASKYSCCITTFEKIAEYKNTADDLRAACLTIILALK